MASNLCTLGSNARSSFDSWFVLFIKCLKQSNFVKKGLEHYKTLGGIFVRTTATGQMDFSSKIILSESDDEHDERGKRKRRQVGSSSEHSPESLESMENSYLKATCNILREKLGEKNDEIAHLKKKFEDLTRELDKSTQMTRGRDPTADSVHGGGKVYSFEECLEILDEMNVEPSKFVKVMDRFLDPRFRHFFVIMGDARRKAWLDSLN